MREAWNLAERPFHFTLSDEGLLIEFRVRLVSEAGEPRLDVAEHLAAASATHRNVAFGIGSGDCGHGIHLCVEGIYIGLLGYVPPGVNWALCGRLEEMLERGSVDSRFYDVYMAPVRQEVDPSRVMEVADLIEMDSSIDVDRLMSDMKQQLSEVIYHVKVGLFVPRSTGAIKALQGRQEWETQTHGRE